MTPILNRTEIPTYIRADFNGGVHFNWPLVEDTLKSKGFLGSYEEPFVAPDLNPDFQRGHVWTPDQRRAWLEYRISGGHGADLILFNEYPSTSKVLVDGLQRLTSVRMFMADKIRVYPGLSGRSDGWLASEIDDRVIDRGMGGGCYLRFIVHRLETRAEVLRWYLELNAGGTPHPSSEIDRVQELLADEVSTLASRR